MDGYEYFNVDNTSDSALIIINGSKYEDKGMKLDGKWYLPVDFVSENINVRFIMMQKVEQFFIQMIKGRMSMHQGRIITLIMKTTATKQNIQ